jgi:hypothetical protein
MTIPTGKPEDRFSLIRRAVEIERRGIFEGFTEQ